MPEQQQRVHVTQLQAENFKRLKAVRLLLAADGALVVIGGENGAGKSSTLDALFAALGGKAAVPDVAVRQGEKAGFAEVRLDNGLIVRRTFTAAGGGALTVTGADGRDYKSPQTLLDALVGALSFDPLAFIRMGAREQADVLRRVTGLDFTAADAARKGAYDGRTDVNRYLKVAEARLSGLPPTNPAAPEAELSVSEVVAELRTAEAANTANAQRRRLAAEARSKADAALVALVQARADAERMVAEATDAASEAEVEAEDLTNAVGALVDLDTATIQAKLGNIETTNAAVRANVARAKEQTVVDSLRARSERLTEAIEAADVLKATKIADAALPVPGLGFAEDGAVTLDGLPFSQASQAQQLRTSLAMGAALKPALRTILVRDGSLLDASNLRLVAEFAREHDLQVLMERVGDGAEVGVVIEDGEVREVRPEAGAAPARKATGKPKPPADDEVPI